MRYAVALAIALTLMGVASVSMGQMAKALQSRMQQSKQAAKDRLPVNADSNRSDFTDFGAEVSSSDLRTISLLDAWYAYRMLLFPIVIAISLLIAWSTVPRVAAQPSPPTQTDVAGH